MSHPTSYENEAMFMTCCGKKICKGCIERGIVTDRRKGATVDKGNVPSVVSHHYQRQNKLNYLRN